MSSRETIKKRGAIILFIAIFSIMGIISCSADVTDPSQSSSIPDDTGQIDTPTEPEEPKEPFGKYTYYNISMPWSIYQSYHIVFATVSYQDTNTLNNLWKELISGGMRHNGKRFIIRDGDNRQSDPRTGNYYYFDKNLDIVHAGKYADKVRVKQFLGGVIVKHDNGIVYTIGGLYKIVLNKENPNSEGQQGYIKYGNDNLNEFMRSIHRWEEGDLSVILMNCGYGDFFGREFGVDEYYCTVDDNYRKNPEYFLGKNPTNYLGINRKGYWEEKLNVRVNHTWQTDKYNFKFVAVEPYDWWLQ